MLQLGRRELVFKQIARQGFRMFGAEEALSVLENALSGELPVYPAFSLDAAAFVEVAGRADENFLLGPGVRNGPESMGTVVGNTEPAGNGSNGSLNPERHFLAKLRRLLDVDLTDAEILGSFINEVGLDSLAAIEIREDMRACFGIAIPMTAFMDRIAVRDFLASYCDRQHLAMATLPSDPAAHPSWSAQ